MNTITSLIETKILPHPAQSGSPRAYTLPEIASPLTFDPLADWARRSELARFGLDLLGTPGPDCQIILDSAAPPPQGRVRLEFFGAPGQLVVLDGRHQMQSYIRLEGPRQTILLARGGAGPFHAHSIILRGRDTLVALGAGVSSNGAKLLVDGDGTAITLGDDCMLAHDIEIIATDSHAIFDATTLAQVNPPRSIHLGRHVWVGSQATILKGVEIGQGSIIGTKSLVSRNLPAMSLYAGVPAREIRTNVTWSRHLLPSEEGKRAVLRELDSR